MKEGCNPRYEAIIRRAVPETFFRQATDIVKSHRPTDPRLNGFEALAMAKVLVVEDDKTWSGIHSRSAAGAGHEVVTASSAEEAKKVLETNGVDFIITDGLEDEWTQVHNVALERGIRTIVVSGSESVEKDAKKRGVEYFDKGRTLFAKLTDILGTI